MDEPVRFNRNNKALVKGQSDAESQLQGSYLKRVRLEGERRQHELNDMPRWLLLLVSFHITVDIGESLRGGATVVSLNEYNVVHTNSAAPPLVMNISALPAQVVLILRLTFYVK